MTLCLGLSFLRVPTSHGAVQPHTLYPITADALSPWTVERSNSHNVAPIQTSTSPVISRADGFDQALVSWNLTPAPSRAVGIEIRVFPAPTLPDDWSPWLSLGEVSADPATSAFPTGRVSRFILPSGDAAATIDIDYLTSSQTFTAAQIRLVSPCSSAPSAPPAAISSLHLCLTNTPRVKTHDFGRPPSTPVTLPVPFRSQKTDRPELAGRLCSPTSLAMVLAYRKVDRPVIDIAERAYDPVFNLFGVWPRNTQVAFSLGVPAYLTRFNSWDEVARTLAAGTPIIASVTSYAGELRNAPYQATGPGHLIVLTGIDASGNILVNDPAGSNESTGIRTYFADDLTATWLKRKLGTAYILEEPN